MNYLDENYLDKTDLPLLLDNYFVNIETRFD